MLDHWQGKAIKMLEEHLPKAKHQIRIATGFFTVQGYNLIRKLVIGKLIQVMVGYDETSHERLRQKLIDDIMEHLSRWSIANRREAVIDLVNKFQQGEIQLFEQHTSEMLDARIRSRDHGKVYIVDNLIALSGSANLTASGLLHNAENLAAITEPERVAFWCEQFDTYWCASDTQDLTQSLLNVLLKWLNLVIPFDVYLKTIQALAPDDNTTAQRDSYKQPVTYQKVVIERTLRQLKEFRGSIIVASTGLGKTVMATHTALRMNREGKVANVIVFAPVQVHKEWKKSFKDAGIYADVLTRNLLDQPQRGRGQAVKDLDEALQDCDEKTLIIIDETQYFVNRLKASGEGDRRSFERVTNIVHPRQSYILLLTATPVVKDADDLNSQLYLLPHTAPSDITNGNGQMYLFPPDREMKGNFPWAVRTDGETFENFLKLSVVTVISTSYVAKTFAVHTDQGDFLEFGSSRKWIPQIELRKLKVPVPLEQEMSYALEKGYFKHQVQSFQSRGSWMRSQTTIEKEATLAWASSPKALIDVLEDTINDTYKVDFIASKAMRQEVLTPIVEKLHNMDYSQDAKFSALCRCLEVAQSEGRKVIVFSERLATCIYLEQGLAAKLPTMRVANAVQLGTEEYELKDPNTVNELILDFAPEANQERIGGKNRLRQYDIFITTDAYGVGVNLQDASVVISYDIAWTPDTIIQRAGRILRLWKEPRKVQLYLFVGAYQEYKVGRAGSIDVERRMKRLTERSQRAEKFTEIPVIPETDSVEYASLAPLSSVTIENMGMLEVGDVEEFSGVSPFLRHITERNQNLDYANAIPNDIMSSMSYRGRSHQLYLLLRYKNEYFWMLYDIANRQLQSIKEDALLDIIQCESDTPIADVNPDEIEHHAQECRKLWCKQNKIESPDEVERICVLYLKPRSEINNFRDIL